MNVAWLVALVVGSFGVAARGEPARDQDRYDFNRDIRPILADKCYRCHGPDAAERQADLRLDEREAAIGELPSGNRAIVAGDLESSELIRRIFADDPAERMPPAESTKTLTADEKARLSAWIQAGAEYPRHWAFRPVRPPRLPPVGDASWCRNEIDHFVLARLQSEGMAPSPAADRRTLIRRLSFDLTGLPPTIEEVETYLSDNQPHAYERLVDRLLNSERFGERMAAWWLDLARYADTDGYEKDSHREMWPYRDWVIEAFNSNMPFDQFTIEQLAGDLLPEPSQSQLVATAFHRNGPTTSEAGSDPDEYAARYAVDRVNTTSTVWLGLTMQCAECHDHKFDPLPTRDYYRLFAYFNQVPETPLYEGHDSPPSLPVASPDQDQQLARIESQLADLRGTMATPSDTPATESPGDMRDGLIAEYTFDEPNGVVCHDTSGQERHGRQIIVNVEGNASPERRTTILGRGLRFTGGGAVDCGTAWTADQPNGIAYGAWVKPTAQGGVVLSKIDPGTGSRGFDVYLQDGHAIVHVIDQWPGAALKVSTAASYSPDRWLHVLVTWDGSSTAESVRVYFNGEQQPLTVRSQGEPIMTISTTTPLLIGSRLKGESGFQGLIDEVRLYDHAFSETEVRRVVESSTARMEQTPVTRRTAEQANALADVLQQRSDKDAAARQRAEIAKLEAEQAELREEIPDVRIMQDRPERQPTYVLVRGDFRNPGEEVDPGVPSVLVAGQAAPPRDRLALAEWIVDVENPLTARVTANRLWAICFGTGIVNTLDDFGSQGESPSHPALLDWLATELASSGWDVKALLRTIVTSSTYRQSSHLTPEVVDIDPENRLLSRGPRQRLPAEMLRDNVLYVSGLLHEEIGGPSVFPYHPPGLWKEMAWADSPWKIWPQDHGKNLYRRSLYTFWKRSLLHPVLSLFDAPRRDVCTCTRPATNTPLQSLVTLNSPAFVEAARALAARVLLECDGGTSERIDHAFRVVLSRPADEQEVRQLTSLYQRVHARYVGNPQLAQDLLTVGESPRPENLDPVEHASWTVVAQAILNLDEAMTKE